ncbi:hypothetical protein EDD16DRAFT_497081 [Pisolithus croceorrhizus]|nr:hypothetical protein EDD16DRAFT_497081 [Pisolithus croceorrhizus]KAI6127806.1 hypothetical protein EV401DRAFT_967545 [Pisolithus croceorrhizus]
MVTNTPTVTPCKYTVYLGPVINPKTSTHFDALPNGLIIVDSRGNIVCLRENLPRGPGLQDALAQIGLPDGTYTLVKLEPGEFIMPGLIDTHIHACQLPNLGLGGDYGLLEWLKIYTYPAERKFSEIDYAARIYPEIVKRIINSGTTTSCYYGTLHLEATKLLADIVRKKGQRAFVGKCNMDRNCPSDYIEPSAKVSRETTELLVTHIQNLPQSSAGEPLVHPVITPRFAISCTEELLTSLGEYAKANPHLAIQTHISENQQEIKKTLELFPDCTSYAGVYDKYNLLRRNTILAHGVYLTDEEMKLIAQKGAGVSHCPASNFYLGSGMARARKLLEHGVKVGLGTDVSGGNSPSLLYAIQMASNTSKMVAILPNEGGKKFDAAMLLYLATLGGAEVCCLRDRIGSFEQGKAFDALLVNVRDDSGNPAVWGHDLAEGEIPEKKVLKEWLERFFFCGDDRNIRQVIVQGSVIGGRGFRG